MKMRNIVRRGIVAEFSLGQKIAGVVAAVAIPTAIRALLGATVNPVPFVTYFPAIMIAAVFLGWRWAALATVMSAVIVNRVFLAQPWFEAPKAADLAVLLFFAISCSLLILIAEALRGAVRTSERLLSERDALAHELFHRVQNILTVVGSLVQMSNAETVSILRNDLSGRIQALSLANRVLQSGAAGTLDVAQLVDQAVAPFARDGAFEIEGPHRTLSPTASHQLVLILHEFCTNALKHGALSTGQGRIRVTWHDDHPFCLEWQESGGPHVAPPARRGLGSRLLAAQEIYTVDKSFDPAGLTARVVLRAP